MEVDLDRARALARPRAEAPMGTVFLVAADPAGPVCGGRYALKVFDKRSTGPSKRDADRRARWEVTLTLPPRAPAPPVPPRHRSRDARPPRLGRPYCPGGDLNELRYSLPDRVFSPSAIRFYIAETISALADLHASGVVYRDLKPENVLLRADGHVTLTDFDLSRLLPGLFDVPSSSSSRQSFHRRAKREPAVSTTSTPKQQFQNLVRFLMRSNGAALELAKKTKSARVSPVSRKFAASSGAAWGKSYSFVGTEEYVAPEVVRGDGHGFDVDWWAVGVLVYEMAFGRTPFKGKNRKETFRNVLHREIDFPGDTQRRMPELTDLISRLLERDPARRLGYAGGADEIRAHPFFAGMAWDMLAEVTRPPYIPPPAEDDAAAAGEGFDVRDYFKKLHQPPPPGSDTSSSDFSSEF
ncbi:hypothetical protein ACQ4PT_063117 [Festuca glaucescens]